MMPMEVLGMCCSDRFVMITFARLCSNIDQRT